MNIIQRIEWKIYKSIKKIKLKNRNPSIISSNCNGEFWYYDMGLRFLSPTINLSFDMNDYVKFLENIHWYLEQPIIPLENLNYDFPVGILGDIKIRFNHYKSIDEAVAKWNERKNRINWDNIFVLGIDGDNCTYDSIRRFDQLPFENKVIFTHRPYPEFKSAYYIKGFEEDDGIGVLIYFKQQFFIRRYLDDFDYISFLNNNRKKGYSGKNS